MLSPAARSNPSAAATQETDTPLALEGVDPEYAGASGTAFGPADFRTFYDENPLLNAGTTGGGGDCVALVEDSNYLPSAVTLFDSTFALPAASITNVFAFNAANPGITGDEIEVLLDIEWVHAVAPGAPIRVYMGSGNLALPDAIAQAVSDNACGSISISYGFCSGSSSLFTGTLDPLFKKAAAQGQSVFVSSGDQGAAGIMLNSSQTQCVLGTSQNVNEMSADPNVTAVGGTQAVPSYSAGNVIISATTSTEPRRSNVASVAPASPPRCGPG
jgi:subtilase family serine protease